MKNMKKVLFPLLLAFVGAIVAVLVYVRFFEQPQLVTIQEKQPILYTGLQKVPDSLPDLTYAAENSVHAVVHITVSQKGNYSERNPFLDWFFGDRNYRFEAPIRQGIGSGVIISGDGYIVTNNHVIDDADDIMVVLNDKREFKAKLVGNDPTTDIAVIKIDAKDLPTLRFGNSDNLKLGQWVLAVGNPFNLTSTVTAGIISAKSRSIGINPNQMGIESFIQTDAAVNRGNSGGALVDMQGELVGINTAIASQTGEYSGYSFAVPSNLVHKVVSDLMEYGEVQRALLGVVITDVNAEVAKKKGLDRIEGVLVTQVNDGGAKDAGIEEDDVILKIDGVDVNSGAELQEQVGKHRPGDKVTVDIKRDNKKKPLVVTLRNKHGELGVIKPGEVSELLGAQLEEISDNDKQQLKVDYGLKVTGIKEGKFKDAGIRKGFVIVEVNKSPVHTVNEFKRIIDNSTGGILIEGVYPDGELAYYAFRIK